MENCVIACRSCNLEKRDKTPSEWRPVGLSAWLYEKEKTLAAKYRMPARERREPTAAGTIIRRVPGYALLENKMALCLEFDEKPCRRPAEWEVRSPVDGTWGANCSQCVRYWAADLRRELDEPRGVLHVLVQLRDGTLDVGRETSLQSLARAGGVPTNDYIDLAVKMIVGDGVVRNGLKAIFPGLRLDMWEPV